MYYALVESTRARHLGAKLISSFLIFTDVFLCTKFISKYPCSCISTKFACGQWRF